MTLARQRCSGRKPALVLGLLLYIYKKKILLYIYKKTHFTLRIGGVYTEKTSFVCVKPPNLALARVSGGEVSRRAIVALKSDTFCQVTAP